MYALDGPRFFRMAHRMAAYHGVIAARANELQNTDSPANPERENTYTDDLAALNNQQLSEGAGSLFEIAKVG